MQYNEAPIDRNDSGLSVFQAQKNRITAAVLFCQRVGLRRHPAFAVRPRLYQRGAVVGGGG